MGISAVVFLVALLVVGRRREIDSRYLFLVVTPIFVACWRGNFSWVLSAALMILWIPMVRRRRSNSYWLFVVAVIVKPVWILFVLMYVLTDQMKQVWKALTIFLAVNLLAVFYFEMTSSQIVAYGRRLISRSRQVDLTDRRYGIRVDIDVLFAGLDGLSGLELGSSSAFFLTAAKATLLLALIVVLVVILWSQGVVNSGFMFDSLLRIIAIATVLVTEPSYTYSLLVPVVVLLVSNKSNVRARGLVVALFPFYIPIQNLVTGQLDTLGKSQFEQKLTVGGLLTALILTTVFSSTCKEMLKRSFEDRTNNETLNNSIIT